MKDHLKVTVNSLSFLENESVELIFVFFICTNLTADLTFDYKRYVWIYTRLALCIPRDILNDKNLQHLDFSALLNFHYDNGGRMTRIFLEEMERWVQRSLSHGLLSALLGCSCYRTHVRRTSFAYI